jgi:hypothetical protein
MDQSLEWLQLIGEALLRQRRMDLLDAACAARAGQATQEGFREFTRELKENL